MGEEQALTRLREILARPEYQVDRSVLWWQQLLAPVGDFVWSAFARLFKTAIDSASGREGVYGLGVLALCVVLLAIAIGYLVRAVRLAVVRESRVARANLAERRERSERLWQAAQQSAATGEYAEAIRLLYLSVLYAMDEHALLHVQANLTNREHAQRLRTVHPLLADGFSVVVEQYDSVRYGHAAVSADLFADFSGRAQRVRTGALGGSAA